MTTAPDANGWLKISEVPPPDKGRVMYWFPNAGKGFEAHASITAAFISSGQWWKPTHWQPEPSGPAPAQQSMFGESA